MGGCLTQCLCSGRRPLIAHLVDLYKAMKSADTKSDLHLVSGYSALLIANLLTTTSSFRQLVLSLLPGDSCREKLEDVFGSLEELHGLQSILHSKLMKEASLITTGIIEDDESGAAEDFVGKTIDGIKQLLELL
ncbi:hypothetical protein TREMEDRAFT_68055 [Tremella mesenterica DSM 1558]|uniref:uncharacterized protein n=1 Tax=Tremella mesenterica (strain ATCC 24925 / CBS 8224 / DSM 1558 / NBRC 9311 / NRRL Y-6157 / RJB 2259-6 / UBC 559-6) TaxID=578456 RepID=UPI0003F49D13|nr:uncharacterized protein TREMEDRAFT_68055 [Tremella mesenterica DSM 1558]EIW70434.1 hypothetical protein TREMEDRAFT_68055 [Tremella mesenterica DSM 1558]